MPIFVDAYWALRERLDMWQRMESEHARVIDYYTNPSVQYNPGATLVI